MSLKAQVLAINRLLSDIYRHDMRLSYLLTNLSFDSEDIQLINQKLRSQVIAIFLNVLEDKILTFQDGIRQFKIIEDIYGLTGDRSLTLRQVGTRLSISHQRVRQLQQKVIRKLRAKNNKRFWEFEFEQEVKQLLGEYSNCAKFSTQNRSYLPRHYFYTSFLSNGEECLTILEKNNKITIRKSDFPDFHSALLENAQLLQWHVNQIDLAKEKYSRAYERWTSQEEQWLREYLKEGLKIREIATLLERQPSAVSSRIRKLDLPHI